MFDAMTYQAKITAKGQLTLPADLRQRIGLRVGDHVEFLVDHHGRIVMRPRNLPAAAVLDVLAPRKPRARFKTDDDAIAAELVARDAQTRKQTAGIGTARSQKARRKKARRT
jgi:antitoxin PrlF